MVIARTSPTFEFGDDPACMRCSDAKPVKRVTKFDKASVGFRVQFETRLNESMRRVTTTMGGSTATRSMIYWTALTWSSCL